MCLVAELVGVSVSVGPKCDVVTCLVMVGEWAVTASGVNSNPDCSCYTVECVESG